MRVVLPTSVPVNVPSAQFQSPTLANLPDGTVRFVLKDGTEIHRIGPATEVYDYNTGELIGRVVFVDDLPTVGKILLTNVQPLALSSLPSYC